jgi:hypothetical protein
MVLILIIIINPCKPYLTASELFENGPVRIVKTLAGKYGP